jgi:hypothetical protein
MKSTHFLRDLYALLASIVVRKECQVELGVTISMVLFLNGMLVTDKKTAGFFLCNEIGVRNLDGRQSDSPERVVVGVSCLMSCLMYCYKGWRARFRSSVGGHVRFTTSASRSRNCGCSSADCRGRGASGSLLLGGPCR